MGQTRSEYRLADAEKAAALARRLEAVVAERLELIERLERASSADGEGTRLRQQLAQLTDRLRSMLAELAELLPPEDASGASPR